MRLTTLAPMPGARRIWQKPSVAIKRRRSCMRQLFLRGVVDSWRGSVPQPMGKRARSRGPHSVWVQDVTSLSSGQSCRSKRAGWKSEKTGETRQFTGLVLRHQLSGVLVRHVRLVKKFRYFRMEVSALV